MIAVLGTGLLGAGFTRALLAKGEVVRVWNRTHDRARALEADGARAFADAADAVRGASRVHVAVSDDAAVDAVLAAARLDAGALVIDHTTTSTAGARERTARWPERGVTYLHAPVFMGPQNARDSTGLMLISGEPALLARVRPLLAAMTGKLVELGSRPDAAAAFKLLGNTFLMALTTGIADMLGLATAMGIAPADAAGLFDHFNPGTTVRARAERMIRGDFAPSWELAMARKDARLVAAEAEHGGVALALLPAITARMDAAIAAGHAHDDWTVIARDLITRA
jgi:3-hydroxyisobutyrate dehydrogenase